MKMITRLLITGVLSIFLIACESVPIKDRLHDIDITLLALQETIPTLVDTGDITQDDATKITEAIIEARKINGQIIEAVNAGDAPDAAGKIQAAIDILRTAKDNVADEDLAQDVGRVISVLTLAKTFIEQEQLQSEGQSP